MGTNNRVDFKSGLCDNKFYWVSGKVGELHETVNLAPQAE